MSKSTQASTSIKWRPQSWSHLLLVALFLLLAGCPKPCPETPLCPSSTITLQTEQPPALREIRVYPTGTPLEDWCLNERGAKDVLYNLEVLRSWGESGQAVIDQFNKRGR